MSKLNQREGVYVAVMNVLAEKEIRFDDGQTPSAKELLTKEMRGTVMEVVVSGFKRDEIEMSAEGKAQHDTEAKLRGYVSGLISNWLRKDTRLNGGGKYVPANPGSRTGSGDEQIKALRTLRAVKADDAAACEAIDKAIKDRQDEIAKTKTTKKVELTQEMIDALPPELKAKLGI